MVRAIPAGARDAQKLAQFRDRRCRQSKEEIAEQLSGHWREDHLFSLRRSLQMYDAIAERITAYEQEILRRLATMEIEEYPGGVVLASAFRTSRPLYAYFRATAPIVPAPCS